MRMRILIAPLLACILCSPSPAQTAAAGQAAPAAEAKKLRIISDFNNPPFSYREGIQRSGIEIEYGELLAQEMGMTVEWIPMSFDVRSYASALDAGRADAAIAAISITPERRKLFSFTKPYLHTSLALGVRSDIDWRHQWFTTGLKHWKVGVLRGTTAEAWARENLAADAQYYSSLDRMIQVLKGSRMPTMDGKGGFAILFDEISLRWALSKYSYRYEIVESGIDPQKYGIAARKGDEELLGKLNAAMLRVRESGEGKALRKKWRERIKDMDFFQVDE